VLQDLIFQCYTTTGTANSADFIIAKLE